MIVKTDAGSLVTVKLGDKTAYLRLAPGEKTLAAFCPAASRLAALVVETVKVGGS